MFKFNGVETMGDLKIIRFSLDNETEIRKAERAKLKLENSGYTLIKEDCGFYSGKFIYKLN